MRLWGLGVAALVLAVGVGVGLAGPETSPVDPAQLVTNGDGDDGGGRR